MSDKARLLNNKTLQDYIAYYEGLNARNIRIIEKIAEPSMQFKDPFNDVRGVDAVVKIFEHMFASTDKPKFRVIESMWSEDNSVAYLRWDFTFEHKGVSRYIPGMSEVTFSDRGLIAGHIDYWDSGEYFYATLPLVGMLIAWIKKKLSVV